MKIFIGVLLIIFSTILGYALSQKYTKIKKFYHSFDSFNKLLKTEIAFSQKTIKEIVNQKKVDNDDFLINFVAYLEDKEKFNLKISYISSDERNFVIDYYENIGKTEKSSQLDFLKKTEESLSVYHKNAVDLEKKYKSLYIKLGFLIGLIIFILII